MDGGGCRPEGQRGIFLEKRHAGAPLRGHRPCGAYHDHMTDQQRPENQDHTTPANQAPDTPHADHFAGGIDPHLMGQNSAQSQQPSQQAEAMDASSSPREPIRVASNGEADPMDVPVNADNSAAAAGDGEVPAHQGAASEFAPSANAYGTAAPADQHANALDEALARTRAIPEDGSLNVPPADFEPSSQPVTHPDAETHEATEFAPVSPTQTDRETVAAAPAEPTASDTAIAAEPVAEARTDVPSHTADADPVVTPFDEDRASTEGLVVPPEKRSNRGFAVFTAILASLVFAGVLAAGFTGAAIIFGGAKGAFVDVFLGFVGTAQFFVPVAIFTIIMVLWSLIANRAGWWSYIIASLVIAAATFFGYHLGVAAQDVVNGQPFSIEQFKQSLLAPEQLPGALITFIAAREAALWIGGIASLRGRRIKRKNAEAQAEYDRRIAEERELSEAV